MKTGIDSSTAERSAMGVSVTGPYVSGPPTLNFLKKLEMSSPKCATKHIFLKLRFSFDILLSNLFIILSNELTTNKPFFRLCWGIKAEIVQKILRQVLTVTLNEISINFFHCSRLLNDNSEIFIPINEKYQTFCTYLHMICFYDVRCLRNIYKTEIPAHGPNRLPAKQYQ